MALLIIAACSGTGKSTLVKLLLEAHPKLKLSVSNTTRSAREGEVDGVHYHFTPRERFDEMIAEGAFVEWAEYAGNCYGTSHAEIERAEARGEDLIFEVEIVGARALKAAYPDALACFILPPSWPEVERRLRGRQSEDEATILRRLERGRAELKELELFDYFVVNDSLELAVQDLGSLYRSAQLTARAQASLVSEIQSQAGLRS
jgi:guanylate kinase